MKRIDFAFMGFAPLFTGCFLFSSGPPSQTEDTPEHLREVRVHVPVTYDVYPYGDVARVQLGQWARYRITEKSGTRELTFAAVQRENDGVWMEIVEEDEVRRVSAQKVSSDGLVTKAFYREIPRSGAPGPVHPQEIAQRSESHAPPANERSRATEKRERPVGARTLSVTEVRVEFEDLSGRVTVEEWGWSSEVPPLFAGAAEGGLVRKKTEGQTVELVDFGTGHPPLVEIPK